MTWTDTEDIAIALDEAHPDVDPAAVRFDRLRAMVEALDEFEPEEGRRVNEQLLEAIQAAWLEEKADRMADEEGDDDEAPTYKPHDPFR